jgi:solute carrier family 25 S-adenosylmethionine transporter 26
MGDLEYIVPLLSGGVAGLTVDVVLFPLDTLKTRLQSSQGFIKAGGFRGIYKGLSAAATGSAPGAALFFLTYEKMKKALGDTRGSGGKALAAPLVHMGAASMGEVMACLVRVPTEVVKQRMQTGMYNSLGESVLGTVKNDGYFGLYRGFGITIMREVPFSLIQFPMFEYMKRRMAGDDKPNAKSAAIAGSVSGAIAAACTTPLDVLKTRIMLGKDAEGIPYRGTADVFKRLIEGE